MAINSKARHDLFQFTPLREGRRGNAREAVLVCDFNSRPSARGDRWVLSSSRCRRCYFNSRPSARGDWTGAVPRGRWDRFQFTPLREGRLDWRCSPWPLGQISIHAPPRGATRANRHRQPRNRHFNSRPSARGDGVSVRKRGISKIFQFTPLREGRRQRRRSRWKSSGNFNSRPSARGDDAPPEPMEVLRQFQFTPLREGRQSAAATRGGTPISIHAPPRGATCPRPDRRTAPCHFNSRPSARGDRRRSSRKSSGRQFQFTPLREGRRPPQPGQI